MGKLKCVPSVLSPDILHLLAITGHGDEIVLADINFPTHSLCAGPDAPREYRADGVDITTLLGGILTLMPLDTYVPAPVSLMDRTDEDKARNFPVPIWEKYQNICNQHEQNNVAFEMVERFEFYERTKKAFAIIHTGECAAYGNIILKRGVC